MKRILRFLVRFYPSSWRKRYGAELDALLEDAAPSMRDVFDVLRTAFAMQMKPRSFVRIVLAYSLAGIAIACALSFLVPARYSSKTVLLVTPAEGFALNDESTRRLVDVIEANAFGRDFLASIIRQHGLYSREQTLVPSDKLIEKMRRNIQVISTPTPVAPPWKGDAVSFDIRFDYTDAHIAQEVNEELVSRLMQANLEMAWKDRFRGTFYVADHPSVSLSPAAPIRIRFAAIGLFAGLLAGLTVAIVIRSRRDSPVSSA